ncbi:4-hydroxy-3-methylbut-2-en-1-yl diphosphate synthase [Candidatus Atribacteria bacterium RBG_19FT_COMBO_35_14]|uniref:4-hydroxy-3-methylbut-2-en-1-yl diphosphate synthase (flavodoxin) n=1 Tax=Candidatus Sediminicultor quintus TaxID=1797291 RepID=A0A1F5A8M9_9BACT|nr:MAG: 4-hydroxy-3-methylbut-2-en-1-yl diphosphate synthase [Candidatus Atribacteria bacterium RBG_19FT_COMBO_35_14]OGD31529.1 MAG: 4-hydroxy-3-methylbut-2-en-1-yl diphosphate synthase [Candidatus Atribacteria bacterium RBG_16_35_8]
MRKKTRSVKVGNLEIGGNAPISVQSMTNTDTKNISDTVSQIKRMEKEGCELVRVAVPDLESCYSLPLIKKEITIPLVADIHYNYKLALKSIEFGVDGLRINPGNIGNSEKIKLVIKSAKKMDLPIRFGINSGSLDKNILKKHKKVTPQALIESAVNVIKILDELNYHNVIFSIKSTDIINTIEANNIFSSKYDYPLHLGITEAGPPFQGIIKSSVGIGALLFQGIGDTIRVSLTGDPVEEIKVGYEILKALHLRQRGINLISCPTCGRCKVNLISIVKKIEKQISTVNKPLTIAVMGCMVNGPGEAKEADIGVAFDKDKGVLFKKGKIIAKSSDKIIIKRLLEEVKIE